MIKTDLEVSAVHTMNFENYRFHYNPDMSGDVIVAGDGPNRAIPVPARVLLAFVAEIVRYEKMARLELASTPAEIFDLPPNNPNAPLSAFDQDMPK